MFDTSPLSDLCSLLNGLAFRPDQWSDRGLPIIRIQNLNGAKEFNFVEGHISDSFIIPKDTVLFSWSGNRGTSFGPYWWSGPTGVLNQHIFKVTPRGGVDKRWLYYVLDLARELAESQAHGGSGLVHVRRSDLVKYRLPTPPSVDEQIKIASVLNHIEKCIDHTQSLISKLKAMKAGLLNDLLTKGIDENGELRDPVAHPERFKKSLLGLIPKKWNVTSMQDLTCKIVDGVHKTPVYKEEGIPFLTVENLTAGSGISFENARRISPKDHAAFSKRADPKPLDVLVTKDGTLGVARVVPEGSPSFSIFVSVAQLRPRSSVALPWLISSFFESTGFVHQLGTLSAGTGLKHIHLEHFRSFQIAAPLLEEQKAMFEILSAHADCLCAEETVLAKLKLMKQGLTEDLLTGRVRVVPGRLTGESEDS